MKKKKGGKSPRRKGFQAEREVVQIAKEFDLDARRTPCSQGVDVWIGNRSCSVKRRKRGMEWAYKELEKNEVVLFRADKKPWLKIEIWPSRKYWRYRRHVV